MCVISMFLSMLIQSYTLKCDVLAYLSVYFIGLHAIYMEYLISTQFRQFRVIFNFRLNVSYQRHLHTENGHGNYYLPDMVTVI